MTERGLQEALVVGISRLTWRSLGMYAGILIVAFAAISLLSLQRALRQSANVIESLLGLYADPGGERTSVAPAMLADALTDVGSRFVITRATNDRGTARTYYLTPGMPAKEVSGIDRNDGSAAVREALLGALESRRWQYQVMHHQSGEFDIFVAADRMPYVLSLVGVAVAALLLLPVGAALSRRTTRHTVVSHLRPVQLLRQTITEISPDDLSRRIQVPTGLAETTEIAQAVNRLVARVERSHGALQAFTADASHELRTPITYLRAQAQWALDGARSESELRDALTSVTAEAERMHRLVEGLLLLARGDNRDLAMRRDPFEVAPLVAEIAEITGGMATGRHIAVQTQVPAGTIAIGDEGHTRQILLNLVSNAVRYTVCGAIRVHAAVDERAVRISVEDTGAGIAADQLPRIFERFARADTSRSREHGGAGLGLAIARMLAELQGGSLEVVSAAGSGSRFTLQLPKAR